MRTMGRRGLLASTIVLLLGGTVLVVNSQTDHTPASVIVDFSSTDTLADLYRVSSAILDAEIVSGPVFTATDESADQHPGSGPGADKLPLATKYAVYEVVVRSVIQKRPEVTLSQSESTIRVGFNVINPDLKKSEIGNIDALRNSGFPQASDLPSAGSTVLLFVGPTILGAQGDGYEAVSYGSPSNGTVRIHFSPGKLTGTDVPLTELQSEAVAAEFALAKATQGD